MCIQSDLNRFLASHNWADETRDKYRRVLVKFLNDYPDCSLDGAELLSWLQGQRWGHSAQYIALNAIRNWLRWKYGQGHPALSAKLRRPPVKPQRTLTFEQVIRLLESFDRTTPVGRRDLAMCSLFLDTGLRVSEICRLEMRYLDVDGRQLSVIVKGGEWGTAVFSPATAAYMQKWLTDRSSIAAKGVNTVFVSVGGLTPGRPLTRDGVKTNVRKWGERAEIGKLSPHDFRRTFATLSTRLGAPTRIVQEAGRWKSIQMVERYTQAINPHDFDPYFPVNAAISRKKRHDAI